MTSISDILTASKNLVTAVNGLGQTYLKVNGAVRSVSATGVTPVLISSGQGRLASISVTAISGGHTGMIYDLSSTDPAGIVIANSLCFIDHAKGVTYANLPYNNGLVVVPGTGMTVVVSYSEG
jgi:hypothetical protein